MLDAGWAALLLLLCAAAAWRDPRRMRVPVLLAAGLTSAVLGALHAATRSPDPLRSALGWAVTVTAAALSAGVAAVLLRQGLTVLRRRGGLAAAATVLGGSALVAVGAVNVWALTTRPPALRLPVLALDALTGYGVALLLSFALLVLVLGRQRASGPADFVVVLGAGLTCGRVSGILARRLRQALELLAAAAAAGSSPVLVLAGGQGPDEPWSEAAAMAAWLRARGVPATRLRLEDRSRNTEENLRNSADVMQPELPDYRCTVVTSDFHVYRTLLLARRLGLSPTVVGARTAPPTWLTGTVREFVAALWLERSEVLLLSCLLLPSLAHLLAGYP